MQPEHEDDVARSRRSSISSSESSEEKAVAPAVQGTTKARDAKASANKNYPVVGMTKSSRRQESFFADGTTNVAPWEKEETSTATEPPQVTKTAGAGG